jgi:hypothetical protein
MLQYNNGFVAIDYPVPWHRFYEATPGPGCPGCEWGFSGETLTGCHGLSQQAVDTNSYRGALVMMFGRDTVEFEWRFDYYWEFGPKFEHRPDGPQEQKVLEIFWLKGGPLPWNPVEDPDGTLTGTISGPFTVELFINDDDPLTAGTVFGPVDLTFEMTLTPVG